VQVIRRSHRERSENGAGASFSVFEKASTWRIVYSVCNRRSAGAPLTPAKSPGLITPPYSNPLAKIESSGSVRTSVMSKSFVAVSH
jgi:hypothetical protein